MEGISCGIEVFEEDRSDIRLMRDLVKRFEQRFDVRYMTIVNDGMVSLSSLEGYKKKA